ncbi:hypothetical protein OTU49_006850, partial [Cherax quadricarinatus]
PVDGTVRLQFLPVAGAVERGGPPAGPPPTTPGALLLCFPRPPRLPTHTHPSTLPLVPIQGAPAPPCLPGGSSDGLAKGWLPRAAGGGRETMGVGGLLQSTLITGQWGLDQPFFPHT